MYFMYFVYKKLSLVTLGQNAIWNSYGCLCNFYMAVNNENIFIYFVIPGIIFFISFSIFDIKLVLTLWRMKNITLLTNEEMMRRKLFRFYLMFCKCILNNI